MPNPHPRRLPLAAALALSAVALLLAACSGSTSPGGSPSASAPGPRPSTSARLAIVSPSNGQVVGGGDVHVKLSLSGARIVAATTRNIRPDQGHIHLFLDNQIVSMNFGLTQDIPNVKPGSHVLRAEFVASDHLPFDPRDFTAVTFEVKA
jgi:hypothetical protein